MTNRAIKCAAVVIAAIWWVTGCSDPVETPAPQGPEILTVIPDIVDSVIVPGGVLMLEVEGAVLLDPLAVSVQFDGNVDGSPVSQSFFADHAPLGQKLGVEVPWDKLGEIFDANTTFTGDILVHIDDVTGEIVGEGSIQSVELRFVSTLQPLVRLPESESIHLAEAKLYEAQGVLREGEGSTEIVLSGTYTADNGGTRQINTTVAITIGGDRGEARLQWSPVLFGLRPGVFEGEYKTQNRHALGDLIEDVPQPITVTLQPSILTGFDPPAASRGQRVQVVGQGFVPLDPGLAQSMFFAFEGTFVAVTGETLELTGANVLRLAPDEVVDHTTAVTTLRTETMEFGFSRVLVGLSARPGVFNGTITPVLLDASATVEGIPLQGSFTINPTEQYVFIKYLPGFSDALAFFGLRNVEAEIRARVFDVNRRDFSGINIKFSDERPDLIAEYSVIEVGGEDPNGVGLLGLDNTAGKDTGNIRLDDVIGGANADSGELGFYAFGGVFIKSFVLFSPSLIPANDLTSVEFDRIFSPFMPDLGGSPVEAGELSGPRAEQVEAAIQAMGNLIGNTISHEIGHSLGLAFFEEDFETESQQFHNESDSPNAMMDAGRDRPFEERAEINGQGPAAFNSRNRSYLEQILPLP